MDAQHENWIRITQASNINRQEWRSHINERKTAQAFIAHYPSLKFKQDINATLQRVDNWEQQSSNHHILCIEDEDYPTLLKAIPDAPPVLFVNGQTESLWFPQIAIIGSRNPTTSGQRTAENFAQTLSQSGFTITSGLAYGIDACAHQQALNSEGLTVAVIATGPDICYPARHRSLAEKIVENGAIVSEFLPGTPPQKSRFPVRNRIISGLSLGVLVVEAGLRSGTLSTARHAINQGKEVFAIPGSIHNPLAKGCHLLIKQGAKLVETADEVTQDLEPIAADLAAHIRERLASDNKTVNNKTELEPEYQLLLNAMGFDPISVDELIDKTALTAENISSMLLILELDGYLETLQGGRYCRIV